MADTASARPATPARLRETLADAQQTLASAFWNGRDVAELLGERARLVDGLLQQTWRHCAVDDREAALLAAGGYGRGELHPFSDVDVAIVLPRTAGASTRRRIEAFVAACWDAGLALGHSVRTVAESRAAAAADVGAATALMEARRIAGSPALFETLAHATGPASLWPPEAYFEAKRDEQRRRHARFDDTAYNLEPNLKEGPGGLRDIQLVSWVWQRRCGASRFDALRDRGILTAEECDALVAGRQHLWSLRYALHLVAGRAEERLLFEHQTELARRLGYHDDHRRNLGVEKLMRGYFRTVKRLELLSDLLMQRFREESAGPADRTPRAVDERFVTRGRSLEPADEDLFRREPAAMLELFGVLARHPELDGVSAATLRALRANQDRLAGLRHDERAQRAFLSLLREPRGVARELQRMSRFGVLGRYLPAFARVEGHMQYDLFHAYTVDQHTLFVVRNLRRIARGAASDGFPLACEVFKRVQKPELLLLAALFHDIAKGRRGDHSELGAAEAEDFCRAHGLAAADTRLVAWLVRHHLVMSTTAQRRDIGDPAVINAFAREIGDRRHLDSLYLLTVADIAATHPKLWNSWRDRLLQELYVATRYALRRGLAHPIDRDEWIENTRAGAREILQEQGVKTRDRERIWRDLPEDCFLKLDARRIAWQTAAAVDGARAGRLEVRLRYAPGLGATEVFVFGPDRPRLFATLSASLDNLGFQVVEARVTTTAKGRVWDSFVVLEADGEPVSDPRRADELHHRLSDTLNGDSLEPSITSLAPARLKHFHAPLEVAFDTDAGGERTQVGIVTTDRPGLLALIGHAFDACGIRIHEARIATFGERAEDFFSVSTQSDGRALDEALQDRTRRQLTKYLDHGNPRE